MKGFEEGTGKRLSDDITRNLNLSTIFKILSGNGKQSKIPKVLHIIRMLFIS